ncbi:zinc finger protein 596-like [Ruditapes philippinarum]|uniref:zinc finger protein 596-like n=1 Tax=Ruditapes philippinarum TaxID=129788 RepID=UPI00295AE41A|nr:zinc finger protein 596-like [Ruditapes philippinarum]
MAMNITDNSCLLCGKSFKHPCRLREHMKTHAGFRPWKCKVCGKFFSLKGNLKKHMIIHYISKQKIATSSYMRRKNVKSYNLGKKSLCAIISAEIMFLALCFSQSRYIQVNLHFLYFSLPGEHSPDGQLWGMHRKENEQFYQHACEVCGKKFRHKQGLNQHKVTHTGEKPFKCDICGKAFALRNNFKRHLVKHMNFTQMGLVLKFMLKKSVYKSILAQCVENLSLENSTCVNT